MANEQKENQCACGVPNCKGHEVKDGEAVIDHPKHGKIKVKV
jgi:hypothetical protein